MEKCRLKKGDRIYECRGWQSVLIEIVQDLNARYKVMVDSIGTGKLELYKRVKSLNTESVKMLPNTGRISLGMIPMRWTMVSVMAMNLQNPFCRHTGEGDYKEYHI